MPLNGLKALLVQWLSASISQENEFFWPDYAVMNKQKPKTQDPEPPADDQPTGEKKAPPDKETGGPQGPEPTRYGDWERKGRCVDF